MNEQDLLAFEFYYTPFPLRVYYTVLAGGSEHTNRGHTECVGSITMFSRRVDISRWPTAASAPALAGWSWFALSSECVSPGRLQHGGGV